MSGIHRWFCTNRNKLIVDLILTYISGNKQPLSHTLRRTMKEHLRVMSETQCEFLIISNVSHRRLSNVDAVGPCELGHVGCQGRVGRQDFNRQIPAEGVHVDMLRSSPNGDLWLVLENSGRLHRLPSRDKFKVKAPPQGHWTRRVADTCVRTVWLCAAYYRVRRELDHMGTSGTQSYSKLIQAMWLTYVCAETWRDVEGNRQGEVAGGSVQARLQVTSMSGNTERLTRTALVLLLDFLLTLQAHWILENTLKYVILYLPTE